jgi:hypothetical protein
VFDSKDAVLAAYAIYRSLEEKKIQFRNHGTFESVEATRDGVPGFWILMAEEIFFLPKDVLEGLTAAPSGLTPAKAARLQDVLPDATSPSVGNKSLTWDTPDIQRRLLDIVAEAQAADTRYIRVISKSKTGKQTSLARIAPGANAETVIKTIQNARSKTKERTVMAEVLKKNLKRSMARSFPFELR